MAPCLAVLSALLTAATPDASPTQHSVADALPLDTGAIDTAVVTSHHDDERPLQLPPGHPPTDPSQLPPGHPSTDTAGDPELPAASPHGPMLTNSPDREQSGPLPGSPPGTIRIELRDEKNQRLAHQHCRLQILHSSVPEGEQRNHLELVTDETGHATVGSMHTERGWSYQVTVEQPVAGSSPVTYRSPLFALPTDSGYRIILHRYPATTELAGLMLATEGADTIFELHDEDLVVSQRLDFINLSTTSWVLAPGIPLSLPTGAKAIRTGEGDGYLTLDADAATTRLRGMVPPGRTSVTFDYRVPWDGATTMDLVIELPPRVLNARVRMPVRKEMTFQAEGFPTPKVDPTIPGVRVLGVIQHGSPEAPIRTLNVHLTGLPSPGTARLWVLAAGLILVAGALAWTVRPAPSPGQPGPCTNAQAIAEEIEALDAALSSGSIGPKTHARERRRLLDQLALLLLESDQAAKQPVDDL